MPTLAMRPLASLSSRSSIVVISGCWRRNSCKASGSLPEDETPAQRQTVSVRSIAAERHLGHGIYGGFKHRHGSAGLHWRDAESVLFLTAGSLPLERFPIVINTAQSSIFRHTLRVFAQENTVVIFCTFVQNFSLNTVPDGGQRDAAPQQIPRHTVIIRCRVRRRNGGRSRSTASCCTGMYIGLSSHSSCTASTNGTPST